MRIAISTRLFFPIQGGLCVFTDLLAKAWVAEGHEVRILTSTPEGSEVSQPTTYELTRHPSAQTLWKTAGWADVLFQAEVSVKFLWPFLLRGKPAFVSHHTHYVQDHSPPLYRRVQMWCTYIAQPISVSECIRRAWGGRGLVIPNPYDDTVFYEKETVKTRDFFFAGRLVPGKGLEELLQALRHLALEDLRPTLAVAGDGPGPSGSALPAFQQMSCEMGLTDQVTFLGQCGPHALAEEMRRSRFLVVPSTWAEPFGIVALEGLACGCEVIASNAGGLPDAAGPFSTYFNNGDIAGLTAALRSTLLRPASSLPDAGPRRDHLARHTPAMIGRRYTTLFSQRVRRGAKSAPVKDASKAAGHSSPTGAAS